MIIVVESFILCLIFTIMVYSMSKDPIKTLYNYPPKIQERVKNMPEYKDRIPTNKEKIWVKLLASLVIAFIFSLILRYVNGYTTFLQGFGYGFLLWTIVNVYDAVVIDILWFCQSKRFIFKGTEDMIKEYHNYWYHIKQSLLGEAIALFVCLLVGNLIKFVL